MNYNEFKKKVFDGIKDHLTDEYQDYDMRFQDIKKSNGRNYEALMIGPKNAHVSMVPALNISEAFSHYENGMAFEDVMNMLADTRMNSSLPEFNKEDMFDYDKIKVKIFPRLINTATNKEYLMDKPHRDMEDLSVIYAARFIEDEHGFAEAVITDDIAKMWGVDVNELNSRAMDNLSERQPFFKNIETMIFGQDEDLEIEDMNLDEYYTPFFVLTNQQKTKGAVMSINPKIMNRITAKLGEVYIVPSSVDETLIVPKDAISNVHELAALVAEINTKDLRPEDRLSDNIYEYDAKTHALKIAGNEQIQDNTDRSYSKTNNEETLVVKGVNNGPRLEM